MESAQPTGALPPTAFPVRMAMAYLLNQNGEGGVTSPLAMTDGLIGLLEDHGTHAQGDKAERRLLKDALDSVLAGKPVAEPEPDAFVGCTIKR